MEKTRNGVVCTQNRGTKISLLVKISLCSENSLCSEVAIHSENIAILVKFPHLLLLASYMFQLVSASISSFMA